MFETEIKLRVADPDVMRRRLHELGFAATGPRLLERNCIFDTQFRKLTAANQLLRLRSKGGRWWLTWKGQPQSDTQHKVREEIELEVPQGERLREILVRLGFQVCFEYEKYRTEFQQGGGSGKVVLDETPIGNFLELEGPPAWIDETATRLEFGPQDYITRSYARLYVEWCHERGVPAANMMFP